MHAPRTPLPIAVAVMTPPQSVAFSSPLVSQVTNVSGPIASSICVRNAISPEIWTCGALFTVNAIPATVWSSFSGRR